MIKELILFVVVTVLGLHSGVAQSNSMTQFDARYGENYQSIAFDGGWSDKFYNQALFFGGQYNRTYTMWIDTYGDIVVGCIDNDTKIVSSHVVVDNQRYSLESTILALQCCHTGELILFVADKSKPHTIQSYITTLAEDISQWEHNEIQVDGSSSIRKIYPIVLGDLQSHILLFVLQDDGTLRCIASQDAGSTWVQTIKMPFTSESDDFKVFSDSKSRVLFISKHNDMILCHAEGFKKTLPSSNHAVEHIATPLPASTICDVAFDSSGNLSVVSMNPQSQLVYSQQNKQGWKHQVLPIKNCHESIKIDPETPTILYYTCEKDSITEINTCSYSGGKWSIRPVTLATAHNNRYIVPVTNADITQPIQMCWIQETTRDVKVNPLTTIKVNISQPLVEQLCDSLQIKKMMKKVADWQLSNSFVGAGKNDWQWGAFYMGLISAYEATGDKRYWDEMINVGQWYNWELAQDVLHADRILIGSIYLYLYEHSDRKTPEMIEHTKWAMNLLSNRSATINPKFNNCDTRSEWWSWSDALFMAPPTFFKYSKVTKDQRPMDFANKHWILTSYHLYSEADSLFYRDDRFFDSKTTNRKRVFWSRGNGWVAAALPIILDILPQGHPYRPYYEKLFKEIAAKLLRIQQPEGLWTVSLLDPKELSIGESSGSGFFGYALTWGVNNGLLDRSIYTPAVKKAWKALSANVSSFGRLGYVQQIAGEPFPFYEYQSHTYASGAYLMFAKEMITLLK